MKFSALVAALAMVVPSLAAPAPEVDARQVITFADTLTIALTSRANGTFLDRTVYGTRTTPRLTAEEGEEWRYAFQTNTDPKAFTWNSGGKKLQCTIEVKADPRTTFISLDLERDFYTRGLKTNVKGYPIQTNCFKF